MFNQSNCVKCKKQLKKCKKKRGGGFLHGNIFCGLFSQLAVDALAPPGVSGHQFLNLRDQSLPESIMISAV